MAETANRVRLSVDTECNDCQAAPVTATTIPMATGNTIGLGAGLSQPEEMKPSLQQLQPNKSQSKVSQGSVTTGAVAVKEETFTPTLRLRPYEIECSTQTVEDQRSRSKSPCRKVRQAVTSPRRIQAKSVNAALISAPERDLNLNLGTNLDENISTLSGKTHRSLLHRMTFDEWLVTKDKEEAQRRRQDRRELNRLTHMQQLRQELSDKCYGDWLRSKRQRANAQMTSQQRGSKGLPTVLVETARSRTEETRRTVQKWEQRKVLELQRRKEQQMREEEERLVRDQLREHLAQLAWNRWLEQQEQIDLQKQLEKQQRQQQRQEVEQAPLEQQQMQRRNARWQHQRKLDSLYLHVPLSAAQRSLRQRLDSIDGLHTLRRRK